MSKYKLIQLTNSNIGELDANTYLPLGQVTRRLNASCNMAAPFNVGSSTSDTLYLTEPGYYEIVYSASIAAAAAGEVSLSLIANNSSVYTATETVAAADDIANLTLAYVTRVCPNCCGSPYNCPVAIQVQLGDIATSATVLSTANLIIKKIS
jgi:hypothetical protein